MGTGDDRGGRGKDTDRNGGTRWRARFGEEGRRQRKKEFGGQKDGDGLCWELRYEKKTQSSKEGSTTLRLLRPQSRPLLLLDGRMVGSYGGKLVAWPHS